MAAPLPTGWAEVLWNTAPSADVAACAVLLSQAHPENTKMSAVKLNKLLDPKRTYYEPLTKQNQSLFRLFAYDTPIDLCVAFYKTINRQPSGLPTGPNFSGAAATNSIPTQRWWCISVGCETNTSKRTYNPVQKLCFWFYDNNIDPTYELLGTMDDATRLTDPTGTRYNPNKWEVDYCNSQIAADKTVIPGQVYKLNSYPPFTAVLTVFPGAQLQFSAFTHA